MRLHLFVLIESDWNLKLTVILTVFPDACINRIRLEFKVACHGQSPPCSSCINRIRLEFKDIQVSVSFNVAFLY